MIDTLAYILNKLNIKSYSRRSRAIELPDFGRYELALLFNELGFTSGVEIGVQVGRYSEMLCKANPNLLLYSIDPWAAEAYKNAQHDMPYLQNEFETNYEAAVKRLAPYNCTIIRDFSLSAVNTFEDNSLDFVYIDGNHDFQNVTNDICEWSRKVRKGGIVSGHDYTRYKLSSEIHVWQVVSSYTYAYGICPWFILGNKVKSWMWVKT